MEVILREYVENLGERGEIVKVADGYARNYLLPRKLALPATDANRNWVARERRIAEAREAEQRAAAEAVAARLAALEIALVRKVGENDQLYGSVTNADIAEVLEEKGFEVDRRKILLPDPIKALGTFTVPVKLHRHVTARLQVMVSREGGGPDAPAAEAEPAEA
jgi:large subunit ribosomal protein L9